MCLLRAIRDSLGSELEKVELFLLALALRLEAFEIAPNMTLSEEVQVEMKKLLWRIRSHLDADLVTYEVSSDDYEALFKWQIVDLGTRSKTQVSPMQTDLFDISSIQSTEVPRNPNVSIVDPKNRLLRASTPIESSSGDWFVGMHIYASCDGQESNELILASIDRDAIEQCLVQCRDKVTAQVVLLDDGVWSIEWNGLLLRRGIVETPRSAKTTVDLFRRSRNGKNSSVRKSTPWTNKLGNALETFRVLFAS